MTCVHKVRWSVKRPEDCRFRLSVSHYKDRIVAPDEYAGVTVVTPSDSEQVLPTKDKTVRANITVNPAPTEVLATNENGTFLPSDGNVGFSEVTVDVEPVLDSLSVTENGLYLPESGVDGFDRVSVDVPPTIPDLVPLTATANGQYTATGHDGYSQVNVAVPIPEPVTESLSVTENGTYTPSAGIDGFNEVVVNVPTGGGGGLTLIDTIEVNGVNGVQVDIDASWFDDADFVIMVPDLTFSALDWPYIVEDSTTGGQYSGRVSSMNVEYSVVLRNIGSYRGVWYRNVTAPTSITAQSYLYWYVYTASTTMTGTIKIYGIKVTS